MVHWILLPISHVGRICSLAGSVLADQTALSVPSVPPIRAPLIPIAPVAMAVRTAIAARREGIVLMEASALQVLGVRRV